MFIDHLLVYGAHKLVLLVEVLADLGNLLSKLICHHYDYLLIKLWWPMLRSSGNLCIMNLLAKWRLVVDYSDPATHRSGLLLLLTVDLHDVVDDIEIIVDRISTCQDILRHLIWLLRVGISSR